MRLFIEPTETLLFRTGRPFEAGENNFAETLFPPTPETLQGALRATIAAHWDPDRTIAEVFEQSHDLVNLIGDRSSYGRFRITGIALGRRKKERDASGHYHPNGPVERLFPMPAHLLRAESDEEQEQITWLRAQQRKTGVYTNLPDDMQLLYPVETFEKKEKTEPVKGWLTEIGLQKVLHGQGIPTKEDIVKDSDVYTRESRLGIGMNNETKTTREGLLYQMQMIRMNHRTDEPQKQKQDACQGDKLDDRYLYGFVVDIRLAETSDGMVDPQKQPEDEQTQASLRLPDTGWMILGGDRRAARFEVIKSAERQIGMEQANKGNMLYLATPAALPKGWQPENWETLAKPITVAMDRYQPVGGWFMKPGSSAGENKVMHYCVPAGSIYFFDRSIEIKRPFTDYGWQIGYGIAYAGEW